MKPLKSLFFMFVIVSVPDFSYGDMGSFAEDFLGSLEDKKSSVFYSACRSKTNDRNAARLIFEMENSKGLLMETKNKVVVNLAWVILENGKSKIEDSHGGVATFARVGRLVDELRGHGFHLLAPFREKDMDKFNPVNACTNTP